MNAKSKQVNFTISNARAVMSYDTNPKNKPVVIQRSYIFWFFVEAEFDKIFELFAVVSSQLRRVVLGNQKQNPHWMHLRVGWLSLRKLYRCDS